MVTSLRSAIMPRHGGQGMSWTGCMGSTLRGVPDDYSRNRKIPQESRVSRGI